MADKTNVERVDVSALIPVGGTNFQSMHSVAELNASIASAPAYHGNITRALIASGRVREEQVHPEMFITPQERVQRNQKLGFTTGARVMVNKTRKKVTIIQASAGHTKKSNTVVHKVADKEGNVWLEKEPNLTLLL